MVNMDGTITETATITIRRYLQDDIPTLISLLKQFLEEERVLGYENHFYGIDFDQEKVHNLLINNVWNDKFFLNIVENEHGIMIGGLCASVQTYIFSRETVAKEQILYFDPKSTNLTALFALINSYVEWAQRQGVREVQLCSSTGFKQERFQTLMRYCKFTQFETGFSRRFR